MVGCCPGSSTSLCSFHSTCYDSAKISATPSLRSLSSDLFVQLCTASAEAYCFTWIWPELSLTDYRCSHDSTSATATLRTAGSLTDATVSEMMSIESVSISWIGDGPLHAIASQMQDENEPPTSIFTSATESSTSAASTDTSQESTSEISSPVGAIAGGVVGGVVGLLGIIAAFIMYRRLRKAKSNKSKPKDESGLIDEAQGPGSKELDTMYPSQPVEAGGETILPEHELDSSQTRIELDSRERRYEMG